jgi:ubiquinone biosynthesis monooxygenase Coq7
MNGGAAERDVTHEKPGAATAERRRAEILRVDHAGELGAVRIYQGQLAVLGARAATRAPAELIRHMAAQEERHKAAFDRLITEGKVRPTALEPLWSAAGFALGAATALIGPRAAMACTAAVEDVISEHYAKQSSELAGRDETLKSAIDEFRAEELEHRETALAEGAERAPAYPILSGLIKAGCRLAIRIAEKV